MKLFIDCEFNGYKGELISMALVPQMGEPFYHVLNTDGMKIDPWVRENVMTKLVFNHRGDYPISRTSFAGALQKYLAQWKDVTIVADWPDDIKYFCDSLITGPGEAINTPRLNFEIRRIDINSEVPHNALSDAIAIRAAYRATRTQWTGMHATMEQLILLGVGIGKVKSLMPREMWDVLPGGMPYYVIE